jgi:hypothetical protein
LKDFVELQKQYHQALDDCPINHDNMDFYREIANKPHLFEIQYSQHYKSLYRYRNKSLSIILSYSWLMPHVIALLAITFVVYKFILRDVSWVSG